MPIDKTKYPADWATVIRPRILARAGHRCERCKVANGRMIARGVDDEGVPIYQDAWAGGDYFNADTGELMGCDYLGVPFVGRISTPTIVLTIAHVDHDTTNNSDDNLRAWCQRCHLSHDQQLHNEHARATRARKKGLQNMFKPKKDE